MTRYCIYLRKCLGCCLQQKTTCGTKYYLWKATVCQVLFWTIELYQQRQQKGRKVLYRKDHYFSVLSVVIHLFATDLSLFGNDTKCHLGGIFPWVCSEQKLLLLCCTFCCQHFVVFSYRMCSHFYLLFLFCCSDIHFSLFNSSLSSLLLACLRVGGCGFFACFGFSFHITETLHSNFPWICPFFFQLENFLLMEFEDLGHSSGFPWHLEILCWRLLGGIHVFERNTFHLTWQVHTSTWNVIN